MSDVVDALRGAELAEVRSRPDRCAVSVTGKETVLLPVDPSTGRSAAFAEPSGPFFGP